VWHSCGTARSSSPVELRFTFFFSCSCTLYPQFFARRDWPWLGRELNCAFSIAPVRQHRRPFRNSFIALLCGRGLQTASRVFAHVRCSFTNPSNFFFFFFFFFLSLQLASTSDISCPTRKNQRRRPLTADGKPLCGICVTSRITTCSTRAATRARRIRGREPALNSELQCSSSRTGRAQWLRSRAKPAVPRTGALARALEPDRAGGRTITRCSIQACGDLRVVNARYCATPCSTIASRASSEFFFALRRRSTSCLFSRCLCRVLPAFGSLGHVLLVILTFVSSRF